MSARRYKSTNIRLEHAPEFGYATGVQQGMRIVIDRCWPLLVGFACALTWAPARAQDYSAGKTPPQLFASDCAACHKSAQGLAKGKEMRSLASFLLEHYTTKPASAGALAAYLVGVANQKPPAAAAGEKPAGSDSASAEAKSADGKPRANQRDAAKPSQRPTAVAAVNPAALPHAQQQRALPDTDEPNPVAVLLESYAASGAGPASADETASDHHHPASAAASYARSGERAAPATDAPAASQPEPGDRSPAN